ncbi:MAG: pyridoxal phosphate-dependent aminotransferase [Bacillota bacterium]
MNFHGGNIYKYSENIIDFSSNINPMGVPRSFKRALESRIHELERYPDIEYSSTRKSIGRYLGINECEAIMLGNGAVDIIYKLMECLAELGCRKAISPSPTFSEYSRAASCKGIRAVEFQGYEEDYSQLRIKEMMEHVEAYSVLLLCNPNNPTGTLIGISELESIASELERQNSWLIIDETFIEFTYGYPATSFISKINGYDNTIVLRAITKFFGMPGIRFGYGVSFNGQIAEKYRSKSEPWNINTAAAIAADVVFDDSEYILETNKWIHSEREYMLEQLNAFANLKVYDSKANFFLAKLLDDSMDAYLLQELLLQEDILIRIPKGFNYLSGQHFRLAVKDRILNKKLLEALRKFL